VVKIHSQNKLYDCIIIGGGPSGLTCAIYLARFSRNVLIIDSGQYRNYASQGIHGFLGYDGIKPERLLKLARKEAKSYGVNFVKGKVNKFYKRQEHWKVKIENNNFSSRKVVMAYGVKDPLPEIKGFKEYYGKYIFHCPVCDGYEVRGKTVGIVGDILKVQGMAYELRQWAARIILFTNGSKVDPGIGVYKKLKKFNIEINEEKLKSFNVKNKSGRYLISESGKIISVDFIFFATEIQNSCSLAEDLNCSINNSNNRITTNRKFETTLKGVFAVGDLAEGPQLVVTACASGAVAAIEINKQILKDMIIKKAPA